MRKLAAVMVMLGALSLLPQWLPNLFQDMPGSETSPVLSQTTFPVPGAISAFAAEEWEREFEDICSQTADPMVLSEDQLRDLVARCDRLKPKIEKLGESERKVYLKRLDFCRGLFLYVLESKRQ